MFLCGIPQYLLFLFLIEQYNIDYASTSWPSLGTSKVQLLGLFADADNTTTPTIFSVHPRAMFKAAVLLSQQYNMKIEGEYIGWETGQTGGKRAEAVSDTCQAVSNANIVGIVGPAYSRETQIIAPFVGTLGVPVISYAATDPDLSDRNAYPTFYRTVPPDSAAAVAIAELFLRYNWTSSVIVYQNDAFGSDGASIINQAFTNLGLTVTQMIVFDIVTQTIRGDLRTLLTTSPSTIIILWADPVNAPIIIQNALDNDIMGPKFTWISSSFMLLSTFNQTFYSKLVGMLTIEPVIGSVVQAPINTTLLNDAFNLWKQYEPETYVEIEEVDYDALFAFDAAWSLILSLQQLCSTSSSCISMSNASYCFDRRLINSSLFLNAINNISFLGVSGPIQFRINSTDRIHGNYYVLRNAQASQTNMTFVPVLKYDDKETWMQYNTTEIIVWPGNASNPPSGLVVLEGVTLRIAVKASVPFTIVTYGTDQFGRITTNLTGYVPDLINMLQKSLKFIPQIILTSPNQTDGEIIQQVANGVYDMLIGDFAMTSDRREIITFSSSIFDTSICIVMRRDPPDPIDFLAYLQPFTSGLWLSLLGAVIYSGFMLCLLERQVNDALKNRSLFSLLAMGVWFAIGVLVGYGVDFHVGTAAGRLLTAGLYIVSLVFVATYTANLTSYLTISKSADPISSIDDIKNGKLSFSRIGILVGTSMEDYYLREVSGGSRNFYPLKSSANQYSTLLNDGIDATFMDFGIAEYVTNNLYCNLTIVGTDFETSSYGIIMPQQWLYIQDIDVAILSLRETGALEDLNQKWFQQSICPAIPQPSSALGIESLAGLFLTFAVISVLSVFVFIWKKRRVIRDYILAVIHRQNLSTSVQTSVTEAHK